MFKGVLLDLGGVFYVGDEPIPGAIEATNRLKAAGLAVRYLTNTTRRPRRTLLGKLARLGLEVDADEVFMPALVARRYLEKRNLSPHLLIHPDLAEDFAGLPETGDRAVVIADAGEAFTYGSLNHAFRVLKNGAPFLALGRNRTFRDADDELSLDAGPFVAALEYALEREATVLGKPAPEFFHAAVESMGCTAEDSVMVGDDAESDVAGAVAAGLAGVLVKTGKYEEGAESTIDPPPTAVADDLSAAVEWILAQQG